MTTLDNTNREWLDDHLEAWLDGTLSDTDAARFNEGALLDEELSRQVELSQAVSTGLKSLYTESAPPHIARAVMSHVRKSQARRFLDALGNLTTGRLKPVVALAVLLIVVVTSITVSGDKSIQDPSVSQALDEVKWTLALLSDVSNTTANTVKETVIENRMVYPVSRSLNSVMEN